VGYSPGVLDAAHHSQKDEDIQYVADELYRHLDLAKKLGGGA
jgi:hypothetical protein